MTAPKTPDTTAIRAFAAGLRTSVGIRDELLAARSHLLALCDALDVERAATANKPTPRRVPEESQGPLGTIEEDQVRWLLDDQGVLSRDDADRVFATLDAERAANAELQRENDEFRAAEAPEAAVVRVQKEFIAHAGATMDALRAANAEMRRALEEIANSPYCMYEKSTRDSYGTGVTDGHRHAATTARAALRAAEKAPETTEPAPPAGDGLTAEEWEELAKFMEQCWEQDGRPSMHIWPQVRVRVRAAAEKASTR